MMEMRLLSTVYAVLMFVFVAFATWVVVMGARLAWRATRQLVRSAAVAVGTRYTAGQRVANGAVVAFTGAGGALMVGALL